MKKENEISNLISRYFSHSFYNDDEITSFKDGIEESIKMFLNSEKITGEKLIDHLAKDFSKSAIPENPISINEYLSFLKESYIPNIVNVTNPSFIGHMTSMIPVFFQYISQMMTILNQNVVKIETSKVTTLIERQSIAMLHRLIYQFPDSFYNSNIQDQKSNMGLIVSGGTLANITALWIARNKILKDITDFAGIQKEGLEKALNHYGYNDAVIIGSHLMHYSMEKMASLLGIGLENILKVKLNSKGTVDINELENIVLYCKENKKLIIAIVGIAGTTETGKIDDLETMAKIAKKYDIHFHVDAAWGGPVMFSDKHKHLLKGIELSDSVIICGHKQLYLPQGISIVLCKNPDDVNYIKFITRYQARKESFDLGKCSPEGSRPAFSMFLHAGLNLLGKKGYEFLIDDGFKKANYLANLIKSNECFELIEEPQTNIVVYRYIPEDYREKVKKGTLSLEDQYIINCVNEVLQDEQFHEGRTFISRSTFRQSKYENVDIIILRAVLANPLTTEENIKKVLEDQIEIGKYILSSRKFSFSEVIKLLYQQTPSYNRQ